VRRIRVDRRLGLLLGGILLASFVALGASVVLPASDPELTGKGKERSALVKHGIEVYRNEGCWYCHTQNVRETSVDQGLGGKPLDPASYAGVSPAFLGTERVGIDLTHFTQVAGQGRDEESLIDLLRDPDKGDYQHAFGYLSNADLRALAAYLLSLK
jgi:cytochrome c oxidase cbb3-type subunit 2